jgi:hypothetical protein
MPSGTGDTNAPGTTTFIVASVKYQNLCRLFIKFSEILSSKETIFWLIISA